MRRKLGQRFVETPSKGEVSEGKREHVSDDLIEFTPKGEMSDGKGLQRDNLVEMIRKGEVGEGAWEVAVVGVELIHKNNMGEREGDAAGELIGLHARRLVTLILEAIPAHITKRKERD